MARCTHAAAQLGARAHHGAPLLPPLLSWLGAPTPQLSLEHAHHGAPSLPPLLLLLGAPTPPLRWEHAHRWVRVSWVGVAKKKVIDEFWPLGFRKEVF
jgi:hypothetical protein